MSHIADESLLFLRHWPSSEDYCDLHLLFRNGNPKRGIIAGTRTKVDWEYPQEFVTTVYAGALECIHARRAAFGGSSIKLLRSSKADVPCRCLLTDRTDFTTYQRGFARLRWLLDSVFQVPRFCVGLALSEKSRADWGFEPRPIEMLKAAMRIKPTRLDVIGFATRDGDLFGAVEFVEMLEDSVCVAHVVALSRNDRRLRIGDELWCRYAVRIGDTPILAERHIFDVLELGETDIPALEIPISI